MDYYNLANELLWFSGWPPDICPRAALTWSRAAAITTNHELVIGGTFEGRVDFGTGEIPSTDDDAFILDYATQ